MHSTSGPPRTRVVYGIPQDCPVDFSGCLLCGAAPRHAEVFVFGTGGPQGWWDKGKPRGPYALYATCCGCCLAKETPVQIEHTLRTLCPGLLESDSAQAAALLCTTLKTASGAVVHAFLPEAADPAADGVEAAEGPLTVPASQSAPPGRDGGPWTRHRFPKPPDQEGTCLLCNGPAAFREVFIFGPRAEWVEGVGFQDPHVYYHTCLGCGLAESSCGRIRRICNRLLLDRMEEGVPVVTVDELIQAENDNPFGALGGDGASSREPSGPSYVAKLIARALERRQGGK
jgi:hypothetical protein